MHPLSNIPNREAWLNRLVDKLRDRFTGAGYTVPSNVKITCGFPVNDKKGKVLGQIWDMKASKARHYEIFVSPYLDDQLRVADVVTHELVHCTVGLEAKHGPRFRKCALGVGLQGKMKSTKGTDAFYRWFKIVLDDLGDYPHGRLEVVATNKDKKQSTRMLKVYCAECEAAGSPYIVRASAKTVARGTPLCPEHQEPMAVEAPDNADGGEA